jgi:hypothetical protein
LEQSSKERDPMIEVIKSKFQGGGKEGDFSWMIKQPHHASTLFLFNDNEGEFYAHFNGGQHRCGVGGGNAAIRPYQCQPSPQAIGIPTGTYDTGIHYKGYSCLDDQVMKALNDAFAQIESMLATGHYTSLAFSWSDETKLGGKLFTTAQPVRDYIVEQIFLTAEKF